MRTVSMSPATGLAALILAALVSGACSESLSSRVGFVEVSMSQLDEAGLMDGTALLVSVDGETSAISKDTVESLIVTVTELRFLRNEESDEENENGWVTLLLDDPIDLDLMALPAEGDSPLVIAGGAVLEGDYRMVRLIVDGGTVTLKGPITLGASPITFEGGVAHPLMVPSGPQTGIKTDATFSVLPADEEEDPADVHLLFDADATFANLTVTGNGLFIMAPVFRAPAN